MTQLLCNNIVVSGHHLHCSILWVEILTVAYIQSVAGSFRVVGLVQFFGHCDLLDSQYIQCIMIWYLPLYQHNADLWLDCHVKQSNVLVLVEHRTFSVESVSACLINWQISTHLIPFDAANRTATICHGIWDKNCRALSPLAASNNTLPGVIVVFGWL